METYYTSIKNIVKLPKEMIDIILVSFFQCLLCQEQWLEPIKCQKEFNCCQKCRARYGQGWKLESKDNRFTVVASRFIFRLYWSDHDTTDKVWKIPNIYCYPHSSLTQYQYNPQNSTNLRFILHKVDIITEINVMFDQETNTNTYSSPMWTVETQ